MFLKIPDVPKLKIWKKLPLQEKKNLAQAVHPKCEIPNCLGPLCPKNPIKNLLDQTRPDFQPDLYCPICQILILIRDFGGPLNFHGWHVGNRLHFYHHQRKKYELLHIPDQETGQMR